MDVGLLPANLVAVIIALVGMLYAFGTQALFRPLLVRLWQWVPVVGVAAITWADNLIADLVANAAGWTDAMVSPAIAVILGPWQKVDHLLTQAEKVFAAVASAMAALPGQVMAEVQSQAIAPLEARVGQIAAQEAADVASLTSQVQWVHNAVDGDINTRLAAAEAAIAQEVGAAQQIAQAAEAAAAGIGQDVRQLEGQIGDLSPDVVGAMIGAAVAGLEQTVQQDLTQVGGEVGTLTAGIAGIKAEADATSKTLTDYLDECGTPMCQTLGGSTKALSAFGKAIPALGLFAVVAAAIADPQGTAQAADDIFRPVVGGIASLVKGLQGGSG